MTDVLGTKRRRILSKKKRYEDVAVKRRGAGFWNTLYIVQCIVNNTDVRCSYIIISYSSVHSNATLLSKSSLTNTTEKHDITQA